MPNIDITVDSDLAQLFQLPLCADLELPDASSLQVQLPTGAVMKAFADISKGVPNDCALTFSLMLQIAPFLAATDCLMKVLKLLKPLIDIVKGLPVPPVKAVQEFTKAAIDLAPCLLIPTPANIIPFIRDLLCLILKVLNCVRSQLKSLRDILAGINLRLDSAQQDGNDELVALLQCAQKNAETQGGQIMKSIEPVKILLDLAGALFGIAGIPAIQLPAIGSSSDLSALDAFLKAIQIAQTTIQTVVDGIGGCPA